MLYLGEGSKTNGTTSIASSYPTILRFILSVLKQNYGISPGMIRCELHLRLDQNELATKEYWSKELLYQLIDSAMSRSINVALINQLMIIIRAYVFCNAGTYKFRGN